MAKKSSKKNKDNKNIIIGAIIGAVALIIVVVLIVVLGTSRQKIDDSFFVSDGTKYVITLEGDLMDSVGGMGDTPRRAHLVYFYSGDSVTGKKTYYEFMDEETARTSYDALLSEDSENTDSYELDGKYVILIADASEYEGMTAADAKEQVEFAEFLKDMSSGNLEEEDDGDGDGSEVDVDDSEGEE